MQSMDTEVVDFSGGAVRVTEQIEAWLTDLSNAMKQTLMGQLDAVRCVMMMMMMKNIRQHVNV